MSKHKHFCFHNSSGITRSVVVLLSVCFLIISLISGYFMARANDTLATTYDPLINDVVRPLSVRVLSK